MSASNDYLECMSELENCISHLKEFNRRLRDMGFDFNIGNDVNTLESVVENMHHHLEDKLKGKQDEKI